MLPISRSSQVSFSLLSILFFLLCQNKAFAQKEVVRSEQVWLQSYHEAKVSEKWTLLLDGGFRWRDGVDDKLAYIVRAGAGYALTPRLRAAAGFAHLGGYAGEKVIRREYRPYQELQLKDQLGRLNLSQRLRIEERFFDDLAVGVSTVDFNFRFRYSVMVGIPLLRLSAKNPDRRLVLNVGDEVFINAGRQITHNVFDQNRLILSPSLQWNKDLSIALTYNSQFASTPAPEVFLHSKIYWLQLRYNVDLGKSAKQPQ